MALAQQKNRQHRHLQKRLAVVLACPEGGCLAQADVLLGQGAVVEALLHEVFGTGCVPGPGAWPMGDWWYMVRLVALVRLQHDAGDTLFQYIAGCIDIYHRGCSAAQLAADSAWPSSQQQYLNSRGIHVASQLGSTHAPEQKNSVAHAPVDAHVLVNVAGVPRAVALKHVRNGHADLRQILTAATRQQEHS